MIISYDLINVYHVSYRTQKFVILSTIGIRKYLNKNLRTLCLSVNVIRSRNSVGAGQGEENKSENIRLKPEGKGTCRRSRLGGRIILKKIDTVCEVVDSNKVAQFRIQWQAIVHKVVNCQWSDSRLGTSTGRGPRILTLILQFLLTCVWVLLVHRQINGHVCDTIRRQSFEVP